MPGQQITLAFRLMGWWYDWGVFLFTFIAIVLIGWVFYGAKQKRQQDIGWQLMVALPALLLLPSLAMRISAQSMLTSPHLLEPFFWLGLLGGVIPILAAIGYSLTAGQAPVPAPPPPPIRRAPEPEVRTAPPVREPASPTVREARPPRRAPTANAMLYVQSGPRAGTDYRLNLGNTTIGRSKDNDVCIDDPEVSGEHALIKEEGGRFTLHDRGSTNGTFLNGELVRAPLMLEDGDEIGLGQAVVLTFKTFS